MNSVNAVGRIASDPKISTTQYGTVARFPLALDRGKDKDGNDRGADFPSIVCFGKLAELIEKYMGKGRLIAVEGRLQTGSYEKDGRKIYTTDVIADKISFLDYAKEDNAASGGKPKGESKQNAKGDAPPEGFSYISDDDIPF